MLPLWPIADRAAGVLDHERLRVAELGAARRRVADVTDGSGSGQGRQGLAIEEVRNQAHPDVPAQPLPI